MRKKVGSAIVEYIIPTAVVGLVVGLGIYYMASEGLIAKFFAASGNIKLDTKNGIAIVGSTSTVSGPSLGKGTPAAPVSSCLSGTCTMDFGDFKLNSIPENFASYVETNGNSGGTDKMMEMLEQLAIAMDDPKTATDEGADFRDMANLGHFIARHDENFENYFKSPACTPLSSCISDIDNPAINPPLALPANISSILTDYGPTGAYHLLNQSDFSGIANEYKNAKGMFDLSKDDSPMYAFYDKYQNIMNNAAYSDAVKNLTQQVFLQVDDITFNMNANLNFLQTNFDGLNKTHLNPITGAPIETLTYKASNMNDNASNILTPNPSKFTDFHSAVICTAGKDVDAGKDCHK